MNYTQNHHLPQWEKSDRILMDDFNQAMSGIEAGLSNAIQRGDSAANTAQSAQSAANQAQSTADAAVNKADAAQATADRAFHSGYMPYAVGSYSGNGSTLSINVGFKPSFLIVSGQSSNDLYVSNAALAGAQNDMAPVLKITSTGFQVLWDEKYAPHVNRSGLPYSYIAFR